MKRNLGKFKTNNYQSGGVIDDPGSTDIIESGDSTPPVMGAPMPSPNAKGPVLGQIARPQQDITPKQYAGEVASRKRMQKMPSQSSLGPITGGLKTMGQGAPQPMQGQQAPQQTSLGDRWMGEIWQDLTSDDQVDQTPGLSGVGYAHGGSVDRGMEIYNQTMRDLEVGGIGYARGGMVEQSEQIASMGRNGDTMLMHINPAELQGLQSLLGPVSINPQTGNPEAFAWLVPLIGAAMGTIAAGGVSDWELGPTLGGAMMGASLGMGVGSLAGVGAGAAGTTGMAASQAPGVISGVTAPKALASGAGVLATPSTVAKLPLTAQLAPSLAQGAGVLSPGFGGGLTTAQAAYGGFAPTVKGTMAAGQAGLGAQASPSFLSSLKGGLSSLGAKLEKSDGLMKGLEGLGSISGPAGNRQPPPAVPPPSKKPSVDPRQFLQKGQIPRIGSGIPGSRRIGA
jgi:hypothetical protein